MFDLVGQDAAGGHVVAVAEAARQAENLEPLEQPRVFQRRLTCSVSVLRPRLLESECAFLVAVGAGGSQDEDVGRGIRGIRDWGLGIGRDCVDACGFADCGFAITIAAASATLLSTPPTRRRSWSSRRRFPTLPPRPLRRRGRAARRPGRPRIARRRSGRTSQRNRVFDSANSSTASGKSPSRGTSFSVSRAPRPPAKAISAAAAASPPSLRSWQARTSPA